MPANKELCFLFANMCRNFLSPGEHIIMASRQYYQSIVCWFERLVLVQSRSEILSNTLSSFQRTISVIQADYCPSENEFAQILFRLKETEVQFESRCRRDRQLLTHEFELASARLHRTRSGLRRPFGSNADLILCIRSNSMSVFTSFSSDRFSLPIPCSADMLPPKS